MGKGKFILLFVYIGALTLFLSAIPFMNRHENPNYHIEGTSSWQNLYVDDNGVEYLYRREIKLTNPTGQNQSGVIGLDQSMFYRWGARGNEYYKVSGALIKIVKVDTNAEGVELLTEVPHQLLWDKYSSLKIYFPYEIGTQQTSKYYLYYGNRTAASQPYLNYDNNLYQIGGSVNWSFQQDIKWTTNSGFSHVALGWYAFTAKPLKTIEFDTWISTGSPSSPSFSAYGFDNEDYYTEQGLCLKNSIDPRNKTFTVIGSRYAPFSYLSFHNGTLIPSSQIDPTWMGVELLGDPEINAKIDKYWDDTFRRWETGKGHAHPMVSALKLYKENLSNETWNNTWLPIYKPSNLVDLFASDYDKMNYLTYEFKVNATGGVLFSLYENSAEGTPLIVQKDLGTLPWNTVYFQISSKMNTEKDYREITRTIFTFKSVIITPNDAESNIDANGVIREIGPETTLRVFRTVDYQVGLTFVIGIVTLFFIFIFIIAERRLSFLMLLFTLIISVVAMFLVIWFFPIWDIMSFIPGQFGKLYFSNSFIGYYIFQQIGGMTYPFFYYLMLFTPTVFAIGITLTVRKSAEDPNSNLDKKAIYGGVIGIVIASIFPIISIFNESISIWYTTFLFMFYLLAIYFDRIRDGLKKGKNSANKEGNTFGRLWGKIMFYYFVLKVALEAYNAYNSTDIFLDMTKKGTDVSSVLGSLGPMLLGYGIPPIAINILALVLSDYLTILLLIVAMILSLFSMDKTKRNIGTIIMTAMLAIGLFFIPDLILLPFFTLIMALIYIASWLIGFYVKGSGGSRSDFYQMLGAFMTMTILITLFARFFLSHLF
jgi:hypothetical protein